MSMEAPKSGLWEGVDPSTLYNVDGTINEAAIEALLEERLGPDDTEESSAIGEVSDSAYTFSITVDESSKGKGASKEFSELLDNPVELAVNLYMAKLIMMSVEVPTGPVSSRLKENPACRLSFTDEVSDYFEFLSSYQPAIMENIESCWSQLEDPINDVNDLDCIVAIPVAGHQEFENIRNTLDQFTEQELPSGKFEIVLYLNLPGYEGENDDDLASKVKLTLDEIERFKEDNPGISVRKCVNTYRGSSPRIGAIRSDLWAVVGYDMLVRGRDEDILTISADADIVHLNSAYLSGMVNVFKETEADMVTANLRWQSIPGLGYDSLANKILRYQSFLDIVRDNHSDFLFKSDANTGISLATYFAVGGYGRDDELAEMSNMARAILYYRAEDKKSPEYKPAKVVEAKSRRSVLKTHSRRLAKVMGMGHSPYKAWNQDLIVFGSDDDLRTQAFQSQMAEESARANWREWLDEMTPHYEEGLDPDEAERLIKQAKRILGFIE